MQKRWSHQMKNSCYQKCLNKNHHLIIRVGVWVTSFRWWFAVWWSSSITFFRLFILSSSKHRRWSNWNNTFSYLLCLISFIISLTWLWFGVSFPAEIWRKTMENSVVGRTSNRSRIIKLGPNKTMCTIITGGKNSFYRVGQKQLDDLNLAPCRQLCRWRGETHIAG